MKLVLHSLMQYLGFPNLVNKSNAHVAHSILALIILIILSLIFKHSMRNLNSKIVPSSHPSITGLIEIICEGIRKLCKDIIGNDADEYFPLIIGLFFYILICNLMGIIPGFVAPTANINTNLACALVVFVYYNYVGLRKRGLRKYLRSFAGPIIWLAPLMLSIEVISHIVRPISLSVRLLGNISGDHLVLEMFSQITPWLVPIPFLFLALFIALIQAFVFTLLSIIYISLAVGEHSLKEA